MATYRKKPVQIEAFQFHEGLDYSNGTVPEWFADAVFKGRILDYYDNAEILTLEGVMRADVGDYIIKGVEGEIYPCKPHIFEMTYEKVD